MKKNLLLICFFALFAFENLFSSTLYSTASTGFNTSGTWSTIGCGGASCGCTPAAGDDIVICTGYQVSLSAGLITIGPGGDVASITIQSGGTLSMLGAGVMTVKNGGFLTIDAGGSLSVNVFTNNNNSDGVVINGSLLLGGVSPVFTNGNGADITGIGSITIPGDATFKNDGTIFGPTVLPIELLNFNAIVNSEIVEVSWTSASELNNDYFTIEKSKDGLIFSEVILVDGAGNSTSIVEYFDTDRNPYEGISYYRLKQTDYNGKTSFSNIVPVEYHSNGESSISLFPNPVQENTASYISLSQLEGKEVLVVLRDIAGNEIYSKVVISTSNNEIVAIDQEGKLAKGTYLVTASSANKLYSKKLIVK